ncbi:hypothetical protein CLOM_g6729 [Closterium sp. NIES-68]|nr:hypothetical protein CLOM_g6729 [Closterium sp. NIES-68]GJP71839.1 hypothetical protein CLOP_g2629 [Closterium sp. NIES-67]
MAANMSHVFLLAVFVLLAGVAAAVPAQQSSRLRGRSLAAFNALEKNLTRPVNHPRDDQNNNGDGSGSDTSSSGSRDDGSTSTTDQEAADETDAATSTDSSENGFDHSQRGGNSVGQSQSDHSGTRADPSQPSPPPSEGCPPSPSMCSFVFQGYEDSIPVFELPKGADVPIGPPVEGGVKGSSIVVRTLNSKQVEFLCTKKTGMEKLKDQFYAVNDVIQMRTIQKGDEEKLRGEIVKVDISGAALDVYNQLFNLNPGDGSSSFPEEKRCVVFQIAA